MAITIFNNLNECVNRLNDFTPEVITMASNSYNEHTYKAALNQMRQCLEAICQAIIYKKSANAKAAKRQIQNDRDLRRWLNHIQTQNWIDPTHETHFETIWEKGNPASHIVNPQPLTFNDCERCKVYLVDILEWFYKNIANTTIPADIQNAINGKPLTLEQREKRTALYDYYKTLRDLYTSPIPIDKSITLDKLYIIPNKTEEAVDEWLNQSEKRLFLLLGDAGQGKSSFCKYLLHKLLKSDDPNSPDALNTTIANDPTGRPICFLRLRDITNIDDLVKEPIDFLWKQVCEEIDVDKICLEKSQFHKSILVLDGLDELHLLNEKSFAVEFIDNLLTKLKSLRNIQIFISSRNGVLFGEFKHKLLNEIRNLEKINSDEQKIWLNEYKKLNSDCSLTVSQLNLFNADNNFSSNTNFKHIKELLEYPILLHFIALANIKIDENSSRSDIYKSLFAELEKRAWEDDKLKPFKNLGIDLHAIVREVAFKMHCKQSEFITKTELKTLRVENPYFEKLADIDIFQYLMIAFYTQRESDNQALEFLHKSLKEYLIAEKIWLDIKNNLLTKSTAQEALEFFWSLFSPHLLSKDIENYLTECITADKDQALKNKFFEHMMLFAPDLLERHFLHKIEGKTPINRALFTFRNYWVVLATLANGKNTIPENNKELFVQLFQAFRSYITHSSSLSGDSYHWNLEGANLSHTKLWGVDLSYTNLSNANLFDASLIDANIRRTILVNADLREATLNGVDFGLSDLRYAKLQGADLREVVLYKADIDFAEFDISQLYNVRTLNKTKGLSAKEITHLEENGANYLFVEY